MNWSDIVFEKDKFENQLSQILKDKGIMGMKSSCCQSNMYCNTHNRRNFLGVPKKWFCANCGKEETPNRKDFAPPPSARYPSQEGKRNELKLSVTQYSYTANEVCPDDYETDARRELKITTIRFRWFAYSILLILAAMLIWNMLS